jgi:asparagine synthase (glutamine-hydrolysing)
VDLAGSPQPLVSPDKTLAVTFNGEIYGYRELRRKLPDYAWQTAGDTELLLALYRAHGVKMLKHLPGMFAFGLWDEATQSLFCARDRFGEKPLFYAQGREREFLVGSEIKAILASGLIDPVLDRTAVRHYLRRGYVHPGQSIYENIRPLPPACQLVYRHGKIEIKRYWHLPVTDEGMGMATAVEQFRGLFQQAVGRQLVADVPVGIFLSGGLDSSSIVAAATKIAGHVRTFSFGFGRSIDELPYAREVAKRYGTEHHELSDQDADIAALLRTMQTVYDEPFGDSANIPTYLLSRLARQHITVALAGEGADEMLGGYGFWYRPVFNYERSKALPDVVALLIRITAFMLKVCGRPLPKSLAQLWEGFFLKGHYRNALEMHYARNAYFSGEELDQLGFPREESSTPQYRDSASSGLDGVFRADLEDYLPGDVLTKTDRASMAHGLEMRCPFLDVEFATFCISLPARLKLDATQEKLILRAAYSAAWTPSIRKRGKQGFGAPVRDWLQRPAVRDLTIATLGDRQHPLFNLLPSGRSGDWIARGDQQTWLLVNLALWTETHRF